MRVKARWEALDEESIQIAHAKACGRICYAPVFENGNMRKQLLVRSIYLLYKKSRYGVPLKEDVQSYSSENIPT